MKKLVMTLFITALSLVSVWSNATPLSEKMPQMQKEMHKVDINHANKQQLMRLPGIGSSKADAIIAFRKQNGSFKHAEDLTKIKGIGKATMKKLAPLIKL